MDRHDKCTPVIYTTKKQEDTLPINELYHTWLMKIRIYSAIIWLKTPYAAKKSCKTVEKKFPDPYLAMVGHALALAAAKRVSEMERFAGHRFNRWKIRWDGEHYVVSLAEDKQ